MFDNIFFKNFLFQTKFDFVRIFSHDFYLANLCQYLLSLIFFEREQIWKLPAVFYPRLDASLIPSSAKSPGWKISGRSSNLRIKSRSTMIVKDWPNKNSSRLQLRTKFRLIFERKKGDFFDRMSNGAGSWLEKTDKWSLWSTAAGDKEVEWLH